MHEEEVEEESARSNKHGLEPYAHKDFEDAPIGHYLVLQFATLACLITVCFDLLRLYTLTLLISLVLRCGRIILDAHCSDCLTIAFDFDYC